MFIQCEPRRLLTAIAGAAALLCASGQAAAAKMDFESITDLGPYLAGDAIVQGDFQLTLGNAVPDGMGIVDTAESCSWLCGVGNNSRFFMGLNDAHAVLTRADGGAFRLAGFDASFLTLVPLPLAHPGFLQLRAITTTGEVVNHSFSLGQGDANGAFAFNTFGSWAQPLAGLNAVTSVEFFACTWSDNGSCANPNGFTAQFALDNLNLAPVPEPASVALMALGVAGLLASRRRKA